MILQKMHEKTQGLISVIIAVLIALTFALWGVQNYLHSGSGAIVAAKVNGKKIAQTQVNIAYEQLKRTEMIKSGQSFSFDQADQVKLKKIALQQLIKKEVVFQAINKMDFYISREQLWAIVVGLPIFQINGHFSEDYFRQITEKLFYSPQVFFDGLKYSILQAQLEEGIVGSSFDLPTEIETTKKIFKQRRDFGYFVVAPKYFANDVQIEASEIQKYYDKHQDEFALPEKISLQYVELSSASLMNQVSVTEEQLKQYYQSNISSFSTPKKWQLTRVLLPLSTTATVKEINAAKEKLMKIKAQDDLTKNTTIKVDKVWLTRNEVDATFAAQLDNLSVGQSSTPFRTKDGYNLVKVLAVQPEIISPYKFVAAKVKQAYTHQQLTQVFSESSDKLTDLTYTNSDSLEPAAKELGLKIKTTDFVTNTGAKDGILANNKIIKIAFSEAVLKHRYNSNPIEIEPGKLIVLRIKNHVPEIIETLDSVKNVIAEKLKKQAMKKKAYDLSNKLLAELQQGKSITELVKPYNFLWRAITNIGFVNKNVTNIRLVEAAFNLSQPNTNKISAAVVELPDGYAVLQLTKVHDSKLHDENTVKEIDFLKSLAVLWGRFEYQLLIDNLMHKAKIKIIEEPIDNKKV